MITQSSVDNNYEIEYKYTTYLKVLVNVPKADKKQRKDTLRICNRNGICGFLDLEYFQTTMTRMTKPHIFTRKRWQRIQFKDGKADENVKVLETRDLQKM